MGRHELTDEQWKLVEPLVRQKRSGAGRPPADLRTVLNGVFWILGTGAPWRDLPPRFGSWQTVHRRFAKWRDAGAFARIAQEPEDHTLGRSRGGFGSKFHLVADGNGTPLAVEISAGQVHESAHAESVIESATAVRIARWRRRMGFRSGPTQVAADKGYSSEALREWLRRSGMQPVIPRKSNERRPGERFDRKAYRGRAVVEQCAGWLKERRRIGTRFEKLAVSFLAMLHLAMIQRYLRMLF